MASFVFYDSFYEAVSKLPDKEQLAVYNALCQYALYSIEPECDGVVAAMFMLMRPQIDANNRKRENGKLGASGGALGGRPSSDNPTGTPNVNANVNANVIETDNARVDDEEPIIYASQPLTPEQEQTLRVVSDTYMQLYKRDMSSVTTFEVVTHIRAGFDAYVILDALTQTHDRGKGSAYFLAILRERAREGVKTKADLDARRSKGKSKARDAPDYSDPETYKNMDLCGIREARDDEFA